jgi:uncharacterized integral membrane protein
MERLKTYLVVALVIVGLIVVMQNTGAVETRFLLWTAEMPRALLMALMLALGFVAGVITSHVAARRREE